MLASRVHNLRDEEILVLCDDLSSRHIMKLNNEKLLGQNVKQAGNWRRPGFPLKRCHAERT